MKNEDEETVDMCHIKKSVCEVEQGTEGTRDPLGRARERGRDV